MPAIIGLPFDAAEPFDRDKHLAAAPAAGGGDAGASFGVGVTLSPTGEWDELTAAALLAEELGLDAVGFWDHYHAERPEWAMICGWSAYGYLAARTTRIHFVPMVLCRLNYTLGVLAKESSILALASGGRFELGIGAGDYPPEYVAWNQPFPPAERRIAALREYVEALREIWGGGLVTFNGDYVKLADAACTPAPPHPPRVVAGVGGSRRLIDSAVEYADELNVYGTERAVAYAQERIAASGRDVALSVFGNRDFDTWPDDLPAELDRWRQLGASRYFLSIGAADDLGARVRDLAAARDEVNGLALSEAAAGSD